MLMGVRVRQTFFPHCERAINFSSTSVSGAEVTSAPPPELKVEALLCSSPVSITHDPSLNPFGLTHNEIVNLKNDIE